MKFIAITCHIGFLLRPRIPTGSFACHIFKADTVHRAHRNAQLAAGAIELHHCVHHLVAAQYRIYRANWQAQCAANAPGFVNHGYTARCFQAVGRVQGQNALARDRCQPVNAISAAGRALVDGGFALDNCLSIGSAVRIPAAPALGLRQRCMDATG